MQLNAVDAAQLESPQGFIFLNTIVAERKRPFLPISASDEKFNPKNNQSVPGLNFLSS